MAVSLLNLAARWPLALYWPPRCNIGPENLCAFQLEYGGESMGYISKASVFDSRRADMAVGRVINTDNSFEVERTPKVHHHHGRADQVLDEKTLCDKILRSPPAPSRSSAVCISTASLKAPSVPRRIEGVLQGILIPIPTAARKPWTLCRTWRWWTPVSPSAVVSAQDMHSLDQGIRCGPHL